MRLRGRIDGFGRIDLFNKKGAYKSERALINLEKGY